jgi:protein phosphatase
MSVSFPPAAGLTDAGIQRQKNEDTWIGPPGDLPPEVAAAKGYLYVVADGVGGHQGGQVASQIATQVTRQVYYQDPDPDVGISLRAAIEKANRRIYHQAISSPGEYGMSTTITAAVVRGNELFVANVGDSRAYLIRAGRARQLTTDHTMVEEQRQAGLLTDEEAVNHPRRNVITRSLGGELHVPVDVFEPRALAARDQVLLCTDGVSDLVSDQEIAEILTQGRTPDVAVRRLVDLARQRGAPDNVTSVAVRAGKVRRGPVSAMPTRHGNLAVLAVAMAMMLALGAGGLALWRPGLLTPATGYGARPTRGTQTAPQTLAAETVVPALTTTPVPTPQLTGPENDAPYQSGDQITLSWYWPGALGAERQFVVGLVEGERTMPVGQEEDSTHTFTPQEEGMGPGTYAWSVWVEQRDVETKEWHRIDGTESEMRTFTVEGPGPSIPPSSPPLFASPTPLPQIVVPEPQTPGQGTTHANPVTFRWLGSLGTGQVYHVTAWHPETSERRDSGPLADQVWETHLPSQKDGEWHWQVSVIQNGHVVISSIEQMFWFNPFPGRTPGAKKTAETPPEAREPDK